MSNSGLNRICEFVDIVRLSRLQQQYNTCSTAVQDVHFVSGGG